MLGQEFKALLQHGQWVGEKRLGHVAAKRCPGPQGNEQDEERKAIGCALLRRHRIQGTHHRPCPQSGVLVARGPAFTSLRSGTSASPRRVYLMKLASKRSSIFGTDLIIPTSSNRS